MKRVIGSILCFAAIMLMFGQILQKEQETPTHKTQSWAFIGLMLAVGIPLSSAKNKPEGSADKQ